MIKPDTLVTVARFLGLYSTIGRVVSVEGDKTEVKIVHPKAHTGLLRTWVTGLLHPISARQYHSRVEGKH
ncbi:MAG: hypothetical protein ACD_12C00147G0004 [uncultured bacterium]|nr:MAG: hypothetical protein ACD_12C00147G0004 [uncultured bacterium]